MPLHFKDLDVVSQAGGIRSALIVPCHMCPAVTVADRENKPFMQLFTSLLKSGPFEDYLMELQHRLNEKGVSTKIFRSHFYHQWFMCMWTSGRQKKLGEYAKQFEAVIVLGCDSATETVRHAVGSHNCRVIEGMELVGIMNAKLTFKLPCSISFADCKVIPVSK